MAGARNQRELAKAVGVSQPAVVKWLKDSRWRFGNGPWTARQVEQIKQWRADVLAPNPADESASATGSLQGLGQERLANLKLKLERAQTIKVQRELLLKQYHRVDECERRQVQKMRMLREALLNLAASLPFDADVRAAVQREMERICEDLAGPADAP